MTVKMPSLLCHVCRGIDQDREQTREVIGVAMEKEKASLRCNGDTDFIRDFQTVAAFKTLFGKKNLDVAKKLGLIPRGQSVKKCNMTLNQRQPFFRKRSRSHATSPSLLQ